MKVGQLVWGFAAEGGRFGLVVDKPDPWPEPRPGRVCVRFDVGPCGVHGAATVLRHVDDLVATTIDEIITYSTYAAFCAAGQLEAHDLHMWRVHGRPSGPIG